jgi:uncharacterized protein (DUF849 family)
MSPLLEAALNGARSVSEHPAIPRTPIELARESRASVDAGAQVLHIHVYEDDQETFGASATAAALRAVRAVCPGVPISLTTASYIEPNPDKRLALIESWTELSELVTANMGEEGILELCELLVQRGVGIEAGLLTVGDAESFVAAGIADRCTRVLVEPLDVDPDDGVAHAAAIEEVLAQAGIVLEQVHHGDEIASWAINRRGLKRGHGIRTGLEDTTVLPDGRLAADNADLVRAAAAMMRSRK